MYLLRPNVVKGRKNYQQNYKIHEMLLANLMSEWAIRSKKWASEQPERMSESLIFFSESHIRSFYKKRAIRSEIKWANSQPWWVFTIFNNLKK